MARAGARVKGGLFFRHPPARRAAPQTGGPSGARERDPVTDTSVQPVRLKSSPSAPLGPPVSLRSPEDDESYLRNGPTFFSSSATSSGCMKA